MTPRQLSLLLERHRESLVHREMVSGLISSAVINHGPFPPKDYVPWTSFSPHHKSSKSTTRSDLNDAQLIQVNDHNVRVLEMVAKMKAEVQHDG